MSTLNDRVTRRFLSHHTAGVVVPFKPKPGVPVEVIHGRKYALSTDGGPLGDEDEPGSGLFGDHPNLIQTPRQGSKWRFLWLYDVDKHFVSMWRVSDGNEKAAGSDRHFGLKINQLEKKGQLNRVTHQEYQAVEQEMRKREDVLMSQLEESIEEYKSDFQRKVDFFAQQYFEKNVRPQLERAVQGVKDGAIPLGFVAAGPGLTDPKVKLQQALGYTVGQMLSRLLSEEKVAQYCKQQGVDLDDPDADQQAVYWAVGDLSDHAYKLFTP